MSADSHIQVPGNKRYYCPGCGQKAMRSILVGPHDYVCPISQTVVTAKEVEQAGEIGDD